MGKQIKELTNTLYQATILNKIQWGLDVGGRAKWMKDSKVQTYSYEMSKSWAVMYSVVAVVDNTVLHRAKLLRVTLKSNHEKNPFRNCVVMHVN